jgi:hypothetical protein
MSWHCSQALVEEFSDLNCLDIESCVQLKKIRTAEKSFYDVKKRGFYDHSRSGTMLEPSMVSHGAERWILYLEDSLVKTSHVQEKGQGLTEKDPGFGEKWRESLEKFGLPQSSLKTVLFCEHAGLIESSKIWPFWGMMRNGAVYQRKMLERPIKGTGSGLLPTPSANSYGTNQGGGTGRKGKVRPSLQTMAKQNKWPTPMNVDHRDLSIKAVQKADLMNQQVRLSGRVKWPTPKVGGMKLRKQSCNDATEEGVKSMRSGHGGQLNPTWVEWLMGWPEGWTDLKPLAMDKCQEWLRQHGRY